MMYIAVTYFWMHLWSPSVLLSKSRNWPIASTRWLLVACLTTLAYSFRVLSLPYVPIYRKSPVCHVVLNINPSFTFWLLKLAYVCLQLISACNRKPRFHSTLYPFPSNVTAFQGLRTTYWPILYQSFCLNTSLKNGEWPLVPHGTVAQWTCIGFSCSLCELV
jgi:hypothetical protein